MKKEKFSQYLVELHLNLEDIARLFQVTMRTAYRWQQKPQEIPGAAIEALRAWIS